MIALTGRWPPEYRYRHAYQEIDHWPLYEPVTKFNALVDGAPQLPLLLRQAFREAVSGSPGLSIWTFSASPPSWWKKPKSTQR